MVLGIIVVLRVRQFLSLLLILLSFIYVLFFLRQSFDTLSIKKNVLPLSTVIIAANLRKVIFREVCIGSIVLARENRLFLVLRYYCLVPGNNGLALVSTEVGHFNLIVEALIVLLCIADDALSIVLVCDTRTYP